MIQNIQSDVPSGRAPRDEAAIDAVPQRPRPMTKSAGRREYLPSGEGGLVASTTVNPMKKDRVRKIVAQFRIGRRQQRTQFVRQEVGRFALRDRIVVFNDALP